MNQRKNKKAYYHLPGLFEFYEYIRNTENIFTTGARSAQSTALPQTASGEAAAQDLALIIQKKF